MLCKTIILSEVLARFLLASIFIIAALGKIGDPETTLQHMRSFGIPNMLYAPTVIFELVGGLFLLVGFATRPVALALALFTIATGAIFHADFSDQTQTVMFLKNLSLAGGLLVLAKHGAQTWSIDRALCSKFEAVKTIGAIV